MENIKFNENINYPKAFRGTEAYKRLKDRRFSGCPYKIETPYRDRYNNPIKVDCKKCLYCLIKKQSALEFYAKKELLETYKKGHGASFVTLTYTQDKLPYAVKKKWVEGEKYYPIVYTEKGEKKTDPENVIVRLEDLKKDISIIKTIKDGIPSLYRKDFQDFNKNVRRQMEYHKYPAKYKVIYAGEYGEETLRAHIHVIYIGLCDSEAVEFTKKCWKGGLIQVGALAQGGLRYLIDYVTKSQTTKEMKDKLKERGVQAPFIYHSINMGKEWILQNEDKLIKNNFIYYSGKTAQETLIPSELIKKICIRHDINYYNVYENLYKQNKARVTEKAKLKGITEDEYLFEERMLREMNNYQAIRSKGERPISPEYINKINYAESYFRPVGKIIKTHTEPRKWANVIKALAESEDIVYNFDNAMKFFENCAKRA